MKVLHVAGPSDSGKTTLIEQLVAELDGRIATVKSIHHDIEPDDPGRDTHRHRMAGADSVVGITPSITFQITRGGKAAENGTGEPTVNEELAALHRELRKLDREGYDVAIVEGFSEASLPAVILDTDSNSATDTIADKHDTHEQIITVGETPDDIDIADIQDWLATDSTAEYNPDTA